MLPRASIFRGFTLRLEFSALVHREKRENVQFHSTHNFPKSYKLEKNLSMAAKHFWIFSLDPQALWKGKKCVALHKVSCESRRRTLFIFRRGLWKQLDINKGFWLKKIPSFFVYKSMAKNESEILWISWQEAHFGFNWYFSSSNG